MLRNIISDNPVAEMPSSGNIGKGEIRFLRLSSYPPASGNTYVPTERQTSGYAAASSCHVSPRIVALIAVDSKQVSATSSTAHADQEMRRLRQRQRICGALSECSSSSQM